MMMSGMKPLLEVEHDADAPAVGFVAQVRDALDLAVVDQGRDLLHQGGLVYGIGNPPG
jgi:hypothetical protein